MCLCAHDSCAEIDSWKSVQGFNIVYRFVLSCYQHDTNCVSKDEKLTLYSLLGLLRYQTGRPWIEWWVFHFSLPISISSVRLRKLHFSLFFSLSLQLIQTHYLKGLVKNCLKQKLETTYLLERFQHKWQTAPNFSLRWVGLSLSGIFHILIWMSNFTTELLNKNLIGL